MPRSVAIVLSPDYSSRLERLAFQTPVWLVDTPANLAAAERAWHAAVEWPHITVTLFRAPAGRPQKDDWRALIDQIAFREKSFDAVEVIGADADGAAREAFVEAGFTLIETTAAGFRARRL